MIRAHPNLALGKHITAHFIFTECTAAHIGHLDCSERAGFVVFVNIHLENNNKKN